MLLTYLPMSNISNNEQNLNKYSSFRRLILKIVHHSSDKIDAFTIYQPIVYMSSGFSPQDKGTYN